MLHAYRTSAAAARGPFIGLDLLRLCAAVLVMIYHFGFWHWTPGQPILPNVFTERLSFGGMAHFGWVGVEIFFVISGFVISSSAQGVTAGHFARSRLLRLVPGVWICASITLGLLATVMGQRMNVLLPKYLSTILFWPFLSIDGVYWTLGIEISFYALVYMLLRRGRMAVFEPLMVALGVCGFLFWMTALTLVHLLDGANGLAGILRILVVKAEGNRVLQLLLIQHGCLFALGVVLHRGFTEAFPPQRRIILVGLVAACALEIIGQNTIIARAAGLALSPLPALTAWGVAMMLFATTVACNDRLLAAVGSRTNLVRFVGRLTYPLYLIHDTVVMTAAVLLAPILGLYSLMVGMVAAIIVAGVLERFPERALRRFIGGRLPATVTLSRGPGDGDPFVPEHGR
jgi:peptidoglycan/LPS O-acetylase OafA/YrhL